MWANMVCMMNCCSCDARYSVGYIQHALSLLRPPRSLLPEKGRGAAAAASRVPTRCARVVATMSCRVSTSPAAGTTRRMLTGDHCTNPRDTHETHNRRLLRDHASPCTRVSTSPAAGTTRRMLTGDHCTNPRDAHETHNRRLLRSHASQSTLTHTD